MLAAMRAAATDGRWLASLFGEPCICSGGKSRRYSLTRPRRKLLLAVPRTMPKPSALRRKGEFVSMLLWLCTNEHALLRFYVICSCLSPCTLMQYALTHSRQHDIRPFSSCPCKSQHNLNAMLCLR